ncbi:hypothetical protein ACIBQ6_23195 [Nonomuraea sp. NPDC049655]|uniref:hypothetical protein n=1 Tax=Nonomuraea sp. NPDC049655 TaxID=3364355 RepID=UPI0037BA9004
MSDWFNHGNPARDFTALWALIEVLLEWADPRAHPGQPGQAAVIDVYRRRWKLLWEDARDERRPPGPAPRPVNVHPGQKKAAADGAPRNLKDVLLSTHIDLFLDVSDIISDPLAEVPRSENRLGWRLFPPRPMLRCEMTWPIRHYKHRVGYLAFHSDDNPSSWSVAVPEWRWEGWTEGYDGFVEQELDEDTLYARRYAHVRYLRTPPAERAGTAAAWADPTSALVALARWHYCPRAALTALFRLVDAGLAAREASVAVHIVPAVGENLVQRACEVRSETGRPILDQVDDFLPIGESGWEPGGEEPW